MGVKSGIDFLEGVGMGFGCLGLFVSAAFGFKDLTILFVVMISGIMMLIIMVFV